LSEVAAWLETRTDVPICRVGYRKALNSPREISEEVRTFLGIDLDVNAMVGEVDPSLYRNRRT